MSKNYLIFLLKKERIIIRRGITVWPRLFLNVTLTDPLSEGTGVRDAAPHLHLYSSRPMPLELPRRAY